MWRWWALGLVACTPTSSSQQAPRERDVLIEAFPGGTIVYQDTFGQWQLAPRVGERYGFDVSEEFYAVAVVDVARQRVDSIYATVAERPDIVWHTDENPTPSHVVSGTVDGLGMFGGTVAGRLHSQQLPTEEPSQAFALGVADGPQAIVFARNQPPGDQMIDSLVGSLIVRRDVLIAEDVVADADFAIDGQSTTFFPAQIHNGMGGVSCGVTSTFSFGDTAVDLGTVPDRVALAIIAPRKSLWRGGDLLTLVMACSDSRGGFRTSSRHATVFEAIPNQFEMPSRFDGAGVIVQADHRFQFSWDAYVFAERYTATLGAGSCVGSCGPRWTSEITPRWVGARATVAVISPPDLEALGLWDPALALPADSEWSLMAEGSYEVTDSVLGATRFTAGETGRLAP